MRLSLAQTIRFNEDVARALEGHARETGMKKNRIVNDILREKLIGETVAEGRGLPEGHPDTENG